MQKDFIEEAQTQLKVSMQKEIAMMREILANMHQEEISLLMQDKDALDQVLQERSFMVERLGIFRKERILTSEKIEHLILPPLEKDCEVVAMGEQIAALTERMNFQKCRNENLLSELKKLGRLPSSTVPFPQSSKPKKISIATIDKNEEE